jgi:inward rectifier potassium channel
VRKLREQQTVTRDGRPNIVQIGLRRRPLQDLYFSLLTSSWTRLFALAVVLYTATNTAFAVAYSEFGGIEGAHQGSFRDGFFFSVQTMSTIGYGGMVPKSLAANLLVTLEAFIGLVGFAMATGMMFAKFARPTARVLFSRFALIGPQNGVVCLQFRMANERRNNQILEAQLRATLYRSETTKEGALLRRMIDLPLLRDRMGMFSLSWLAFHPIVEGSPLYGATAQSLVDQSAEIIIAFTGTDEASAQFVHARFSYRPADLIWNARFVDIIDTLPDGRRAVNYHRFHDHLPLAASGAPAAEAPPPGTTPQ